MARTPRATRGVAIALAAVAGTALVAGAVLAARPGGSTRPPNIVVIMTDDQTAESLRVMPNVAELIAAEGVTFSDSVVSYSLCCPSRATYLTGQYAHNHGVRSNVPPTGGYGAFEQQDTTFPVALQEAGYDTVHIGKYLNGYGTEPPVEVPPGWSEWHGSIDPTSYRYTGFTLLEDGRERTYDDEYQTDVYTELATAAIRSRAGSDAPLFLDVAYLAPHTAVPEGGNEEGDLTAAAVPAPRHAGAFDAEPLPQSPAFDEADVTDKPLTIQVRPRLSEETTAKVTNRYRRYLETLLAVDEGVAQIVDALDAAGELDDTIIVFTSDNGFFFGEHRIPGGKLGVYEPSIRVPLLMRGPGIPAGESRGSLVANIDLAPTILDLAGATPLRTMDGRSLVPILDEDPPPEDRAVLLEAGDAHGGDIRIFGVHTSRYVYVERVAGRRELYDLAADPAQLENRVDDPSLTGVQATLAERLAQLEGCAGEDCDVG